MELRQLAYFVAVAKAKSFTRAAERLYVAQPAVSQQIRRLEAELGAQLFDRSNRRPQLTAAGETLLAHAQQALAASEAGRAALDALNGVVAGRLRLGTIPGVPRVDLAGLLSGFHTAHPRVEITLGEDQPLPAHRRGPPRRLRRGDRRFRPHRELPRGCPSNCWMSSRSYSSPHPPTTSLAADSARISQLRGEPFVTLTRGSALRRHIEEACEGAGFAARIALETTDPRLLCELVSHGLGVTIVPASIAEFSAADRTQLSMVRIDPPIVERHTALAWRTDKKQAPAAEAFLTAASDWAADRMRSMRTGGSGSRGRPRASATSNLAANVAVPDTPARR